MKKRLKKIVSAIKKVGTLNLVLMFVGAFFIWFNWQMILLYRQCDSMPETYACAVVAATIGECGICGWIRTNKDKQQDRKWAEEDRQRMEREAQQPAQDFEPSFTAEQKNRDQ